MNEPKIYVIENWIDPDIRFQLHAGGVWHAMTRAELELLAENIDVLLDDPVAMPQAETMFDYMTRPMK